MFKLLNFIIIFLFVSLTIFSQETIKMGLFQLEPFMIEDSETGEITGATVEYWKQYLAPKMGVKLEIIGVFPIVRAVAMLEKGEIDVIPQMTKIPEREALFIYPESILTDISSCIVVLPDSPINMVESSKDLFDKKIGFLEAAYIPPILIHDRIVFENVGNYDYRQINFNKLFTKRIDAYLDINYVSLLFFLRQKKYIGKVKIIMLPVQSVPVYSIFHKSKKSEKWVKDYDVVNSQGLSDKVFDQFSASFLNSEE